MRRRVSPGPSDEIRPRKRKALNAGPPAYGSFAKVLLEWAALATLVIYLVATDDIVKWLSVFTLEVPAGLRYAFGPRSITLLDLSFVLCCALGIAVSGRVVVGPFIWLFFAQALSLLLFLPVLISESGHFLDGLVKLITEASAYLAITHVISRSQLRRAIDVALYLLLLGLFIQAGLVALGVSSSGRLYTAGMGPNDSGLVFGAAGILHLSRALRTRRKVRMALASCGLFFSGMILSGCRSALLWMTVVMPLLFRARGVRVGKRMSVTLGIAFMCVLIILWSPWGRGLQSRYTLPADLLRPGGGLIGRINAMASGLALVLESPLGVGYSDWYIEYRLGQHTHNMFLQGYLQLGPLVVVCLPLVRRIVRVVLSNTDESFTLLFLLLGGLLDYPFYNPKVFLLVAALTQFWGINRPGVLPRVAKDVRVRDMPSFLEQYGMPG